MISKGSKTKSETGLGFFFIKDQICYFGLIPIDALHLIFTLCIQFILHNDETNALYVNVWSDISNAKQNT